MSASLAADRAARQSSHNSPAVGPNGSISDGPLAIERPPARDPMPSVKGLKCTYDPLLDRVHNKSVSRNAKPTYKEFGRVRTIIYFSPFGGASSVVKRLMANETG
jgi:histone-lysine N-methyltransferase SETD1